MLYLAQAKKGHPMITAVTFKGQTFTTNASGGRTHAVLSSKNAGLVRKTALAQASQLERVKEQSISAPELYWGDDLKRAAKISAEAQATLRQLADLGDNERVYFVVSWHLDEAAAIAKSRRVAGSVVVASYVVQQ